jgi:hypothetical protein
MEDLICSRQCFALIARNQSELEKVVETETKERAKSPTEFRRRAAEHGFVIGIPDHCVE